MHFLPKKHCFWTQKALFLPERKRFFSADPFPYMVYIAYFTELKLRFQWPFLPPTKGCQVLPPWHTPIHKEKRKLRKIRVSAQKSYKVDIISKFSQTSSPVSCLGSPPRPRDWGKRSRGRDQGIPDNCRKHVEKTWEKWGKDQCKLRRHMKKTYKHKIVHWEKY